MKIKKIDFFILFFLNFNFGTDVKRPIIKGFPKIFEGVSQGISSIKNKGIFNFNEKIKPLFSVKNAAISTVAALGLGAIYKLNSSVIEKNIIESQLTYFFYKRKWEIAHKKIFNGFDLKKPEDSFFNKIYFPFLNTLSNLEESNFDSESIKLFLNYGLEYSPLIVIGREKTQEELARDKDYNYRKELNEKEFEKFKKDFFKSPNYEELREKVAREVKSMRLKNFLKKTLFVLNSFVNNASLAHGKRKILWSTHLASLFMIKNKPAPYQIGMYLTSFLPFVFKKNKIFSYMANNFWKLKALYYIGSPIALYFLNTSSSENSLMDSNNNSLFLKFFSKIDFRPARIKEMERRKFHVSAKISQWINDYYKEENLITQEKYCKQELQREILGVYFIGDGQMFQTGRITNLENFDYILEKNKQITNFLLNDFCLNQYLAVKYSVGSYKNYYTSFQSRIRLFIDFLKKEPFKQIFQVNKNYDQLMISFQNYLEGEKNKILESESYNTERRNIQNLEENYRKEEIIIQRNIINQRRLLHGLPAIQDYWFSEKEEFYGPHVPLLFDPEVREEFDDHYMKRFQPILILDIEKDNPDALLTLADAKEEKKAMINEIIEKRLARNDGVFDNNKLPNYILRKIEKNIQKRHSEIDMERTLLNQPLMNYQEKKKLREEEEFNEKIIFFQDRELNIQKTIINQVLLESGEEILNHYDFVSSYNENNPVLFEHPGYNDLSQDKKRQLKSIIDPFINPLNNYGRDYTKACYLRLLSPGFRNSLQQTIKEQRIERSVRIQAAQAPVILNEQENQQIQALIIKQDEKRVQLNKPLQTEEEKEKMKKNLEFAKRFGKKLFAPVVNPPQANISAANPLVVNPVQGNP